MPSDEKTEKPTPRRLSQAREHGQVAKSTDLNSALVMGAIAMVMMIYGSYFFQSMLRVGVELLRHQLRINKPMTIIGFQTLFNDMLWHTLILMGPFLGATAVMAVVANIAQIKFLWTLHPLKPSWEKVNLMKGFKRLFSQKSLVELLKGLVKMAIIGGCAYGIIHSQERHLFAMSQMNFFQAWQLIGQIAFQLCVTTAIALLFLGIADWWYQHHQLMKQLRMTRQEVKDEIKNNEGNPQIKQKIRSTGQAMVRRRMLKAVPNADVVVTNPTHFAVAIQYDPDEAPAPLLIAKGADELAFRIRELAKESGVPIVENKPLARSMYAMVEVGQMIPPELFIAVAEVLAFVFRKNRGRRRQKWRNAAQNNGLTP